jgi:hypothetical protein
MVKEKSPHSPCNSTKKLIKKKKNPVKLKIVQSKIAAFEPKYDILKTIILKDDVI